MAYGSSAHPKGGTAFHEPDEGSYTLSHTYDRFIATSHHYRGKNQKKNNIEHLLLAKVSDRDRNVKGK